MKRIIFILLILALGIGAWLFFFPQKLDGVFSSPTGSQHIGVQQQLLVDTHRADVYGKDPAHPQRELMVTFWYPTDAPTTPHPLDASVRTELANRQHLAPAELAQLMVTAQQDAPLVAGATKLPVVVILHGLYSFAANHTTQAEELASQGFFIVGINHTGIALFSAFPDGRVVDAQALEAVEVSSAEGSAAIMKLYLGDAAFVLDHLANMNADQSSPFYNRLDLAHLGVIGHSFGGAAATQLCRHDARCKAGINFDGSLAGDTPEQPFEKPYLVLLAEKQLTEFHADAEKKCVAEGMSKDAYICRYYYRYLTSIPELCKNLGAYATQQIIAGADHHTFVDLPYIKALCTHNQKQSDALQNMRREIRDTVLRFCKKNLP